MSTHNDTPVNYKKGGLAMIPFVLIGLGIAYYFKAPVPALLSIGAFGIGGALSLILLDYFKKKK